MEDIVKLLSVHRLYGDMESKKALEERLRDAACVGDTETIQELLRLGIDVNTRYSDNGWTPLHWVCKAGYLKAAILLLKNGADKSARSELGETPASVCINPQILQLLSDTTDSQHVANEPLVHTDMPKHLQNDLLHSTVDTKFSTLRTNGSYQNELVLKIRVAEASDPDFIEIELPSSDLTYQALIRVCCQELSLDPNQIVKLRKLPNTKLRKDEDIQRLQNFHEIEVVTNSINTFKFVQNTNGVPSNIPVLPANGYQSISKKDQTILY